MGHCGYSKELCWDGNVGSQMRGCMDDGHRYTLSSLPYRASVLNLL